MVQPVKTVVQQHIPLVTRTGYSPQAVRSSFVPIVNQTVHNMSPTRVDRQISPTRVVQVRQKPQMRGSYVFSYQNNPQQIIETNAPRISLPLQNHNVVYQNRVATISQVRPVTYTSYQPANSTLVEHSQISPKTTKPSLPIHT